MERRFKIGDKVVALTNSKTEMGQPRVKGKIYAVHAIQYCPACGEQKINLGISAPINTSSIIICTCNKKRPNEGLYWTSSKFFAKVDDLESALEEAVENEDYELAAMLRDLNKDLTYHK
jgi:hypothetical protein